MALAERSQELLSGLPHGWRRARLELTVEEPDEADRAALILGPAAPGRAGERFVLNVYTGPERLGTSPELVGRVLSRLDEAEVRGRLRVVETEGAEPAEGAPEEYAPSVSVRGRDLEAKQSLAAGWQALADTFPPDWSHCYAEVVLDSSDYLERAALLMAPANPLRPDDRATLLRFRAARVVGYGISERMAKRCLERLDAEGITGRVNVLRVVSEDRPVGTQGPVWRIDGRAL